MTDPAGFPSPEWLDIPQPLAPKGYPSAHSQVSFRSMEERISCVQPQPKSHGGIETIGPGKHRVRWECRRKSGTRVRRTRIFCGTRKEAQRWRAKQIAKAQQGIAPPNGKLTLGKWLEEHFAKWCQGISRRTLRDYRYAVDRYVPSHLLRRRLDKLSPSDLQTLFTDMSALGLSPRTVHGLRAVLRRALNRAMKLGLIDRNPATLVDLPKLRRKEIRVLSPEESRGFLAAADEDRLCALWYVLLTVGLRPSEAFGLKWEDLDGDRLRVRRALVRIAGEPWTLEEPKNRKARVVVLPDMAVRALSEHRTRQKRERLQAGDGWQDHSLIFTTTTGTPLDIDSVRRRFNRLLDAAVLPRIRLYDLRHTAATLRLVNGEHPKLVQQLLGHASVTLTLDTYSHVLPAMEEGAAARLDALLGGS